MAVHDNQVCTGCGFHEIYRDDPDFAFTFDESTCAICAGQAVYGRILAEQDEKAQSGNPPPPKVARPSDGRHVHLRPMDPFEVAERQSESASPKQRRRDRG